MFYSDLFNAWYEAVGTLDSSLEVVEAPLDGGGRVVYYLDGDAVVGVLLWKADVEGGVDRGREVLAAHARPESFTGLIG